MSEAKTDVAAPAPGKSVTVYMADRYGMEPAPFEATLRATVIQKATREEFAAFLLVAKEYELNPLTKEIYAFPAKGGGIVPVVSIDGWVSLCNRHAAFDGVTFEDLHDVDGNLFAITCTIYRKDRAHPTVVTEYLEECRRSTDPWKMVHRMLRHKSLIQCARYAFGFSGIHDEDEARDIATIVPDEPGDPTPLLTTGFGDGAKPARRARKPEADAAPKDEGEPEEASHARQEADGGGNEAVDAEFEDIDAGRPIETASAPAADAGQDTSGSAGAASQVSPAPEGSGQPEAMAPTSGGSVAPRDTLYTINGETPDPEDGRVLTYKNGAQFGRAKPDAKTKPPGYDAHPVEAAPDAEAQEEEPVVEGEFEDDAPAAEPQTDDPITASLAAMREAPHLPAVRQILRGVQKTDAWALADQDRKRGVRLAVWTRYDDLFKDGVETVQPYEDFALMRGYIEFGAKAPADIDVEWGRFIRHAAYKDASEGDRGAMTKLKEARKAELKDG